MLDEQIDMEYGIKQTEKAQTDTYGQITKQKIR